MDNIGFLFFPLAEQHIPLMLKWLTDSRVLEFYEGRDVVFDERLLREKFFVPEFGTHRYIAVYGETALGYLQCYPVEGRHYGMDLFIGEPDFWGRGIGRRMISAFAAFMKEVHGAVSVEVDPHADNERAIRCYHACDFRTAAFLPEHELHERRRCDCLLMRRML